KGPVAEVWPEATLRRYPGARLAAVVRGDASVEIFSRCRNPILLTVSDLEDGRRPPDPALLASAFYVWEAAGEIDPEQVHEGEVRVGAERFCLLAAPLAPVP
ncbi:MAG TPA: hypothetical protein VLK56_08950, partial [Solirubrobacterales bacterium]|nr:hypothetical protein [Solirubrobacterales bacterium]